MAKRLSTRGRSSKGDRIFGVTSGGLEVSKELLLKIAAVAELEPNEQCLENLQKLVNLRITETRRPYLTWNESEKVVNSFVSSAKSLISDIERVADLGEDPVARPHGQTLLNFLDCDFEREVRHHKASWDDVLAWLRFVSARIEGQFIEVNSRSGDYRDFIFNCYYELSLQNTLPHLSGCQTPCSFFVVNTALKSTHCKPKPDASITASLATCGRCANALPQSHSPQPSNRCAEPPFWPVSAPRQAHC